MGEKGPPEKCPYKTSCFKTPAKTQEIPKICRYFCDDSTTDHGYFIHRFYDKRQFLSQIHDLTALPVRSADASDVCFTGVIYHQILSVLHQKCEQKTTILRMISPRFTDDSRRYYR